MSATKTPAGRSAVAAAPRGTARWSSLTIAIVTVFGLFYAYDTWEGVGNLVGLNRAAQSLDTTLSGFGWGLLLVGVVLPVLVLSLAIRLGRSRSAGVQALLLLVGLSLVAAMSADTFMFGLGSLIV
jgi:hypothetical protein